MLIGEGIQAGLGAVDYSGFALASQRNSERTGAAISAAINGIGDAFQRRRQMKDETAASAKAISAAMKLFPDGGGFLAEAKDTLSDPGVPLSERHELGKQLRDLMDLGMRKHEADRGYGLQLRGVELDEKRLSAALAEAEAVKADSRDAGAANIQRALADAESVVAPIDDVLSQLGETTPSPARMRIADMIQKGDPNASTAAKEWVESVKPLINSRTAKQGVKLQKLGITLPDGTPGEADVWVGDAGEIWDVRGNPLFQPPAQTSRQPSAPFGSPDAGANGNLGARLSQYIKPVERDGPGVLPPRDDAPPEFLPEAPAVAPGDSLAPGVGPQSRRVAPMPQLGIRPLVSPKETPGEALSKSRQTAADQRLTATLEQSATLASTLPNLQATKALLDETRTGFGADTITKAKRMFGMDVASAEQLQTLLGDQVMARVAQTKGAVSEREMDLFSQYSANFGKTPQGNKRIIEFAEKAATRARKIQEVISTGFREGKQPFEIEQEVWQIQQAEPLADALKAPAPAPGGIPLDEDEENAFFNKKPR